MRKDELKYKLTSSAEALFQPLVAIIFGLVIGSIIMFACGYDPVAVYSEMFKKSFFMSYYLQSTLTRATPIIICSMATAMAWRAGYINIGVEGQMVVGTFVATVAALYIPGPPVLIGILAWIIGMAAGALYALIPALLNWKYGVTMVITTLMMNYIANYITSYFVTYPLKDVSGDGLAPQTIPLDSGMLLPKLSKMSSFNAGIFVAIFVVLFMLLITKKTIFGYESKMGGFNSSFALYGGTKQVKVMIITMALSGAIAAIAGCTEVFGVKYRYADTMLTSTSYAWTGLQAALIANLNPLGMAFVSIFLAGLQVGGSSIQRTFGIPIDISTIIQCCITLFVSVKFGFKFAKKKKAEKEEAPVPPTEAEAETEEGGEQA